MIKNKQKIELPREKLKARGTQELTNSELLAILLRTGTKSIDVLKLAELILDKIAHIGHFKAITVEELMLIPGVKMAKATSVVAAIELGKRLLEKEQQKTIRFHTLSDVYELLKYDLTNLEQEHFMCMFLNNKSQLIKKETIFVGTINQLTIHPRDIFKMAVRLNASFIMLAHNHPSGDSKASDADIETTYQLTEIGNLMGIEVIDHIIIGQQEYYSIKTQKKYYI